MLREKNNKKKSRRLKKKLKESLNSIPMTLSGLEVMESLKIWLSGS